MNLKIKNDPNILRKYNWRFQMNVLTVLFEIDFHGKDFNLVIQLKLIIFYRGWKDLIAMVGQKLL